MSENDGTEKLGYKLLNSTSEWKKTTAGDDNENHLSDADNKN